LQLEYVGQRIDKRLLSSVFGISKVAYEGGTQRAVLFWNSSITRPNSRVRTKC
jgi:hypothetical protein